MKSKGLTLYCFPHYVDLAWAKRNSEKFFALLEARGITCVVQRWYGTVESLPKGKTGPVLVRASGRMLCTYEVLGAFCAEHGYFAFYDDTAIRADGTVDENIVPVVEAFLAKHGL